MKKERCGTELPPDKSDEAYSSCLVNQVHGFIGTKWLIERDSQF